MPNATVRANARSTPNELVAFDAAAYVALWRKYGNVVTVASGLGGAPTISIFFPGRSRIPPLEELRHFGECKGDDPTWQNAVIGFLNSEETGR